MNIATANTSRAAKWQNKRTTWDAVVESLRKTKRTSETIKQYLSYSPDKQGEIKDVGGFVGGYLKDGRRKNGHVVNRQLVALDVDHGGLDVWEGFTMLGVAGAMYTTHKHTPQRPRFRIVFPLSREVGPEEYEAVARVTASWFGIDNFDDTTYQPTRLMYWPSTAKDGEYLFDVVSGPWLDPDDALGELADWKDITTWPTSSRVREALQGKRTDKAEDPTEKSGIVGAFCRAYGLGEAIAEFLPDVYTPCDSMGEDRYTYAGGSTSGGLVVYDDKWAYSHHSTDVTGGRLCNAFDLVRLHKYGGLDENVRALDAAKMPSFKAMAEWASGLKEVKREVLRERRAEADEYGVEVVLNADAYNDDWIDDLETEKNGRTAKNTIANVALILKHDEGLRGCFGFNEFEQRETAVRALPWDRRGLNYPRPLADSDDAELRLYLERVYGITGRAQVTDGLTVVVRDNAYHPIKDYLDGLEWDEGQRLDTLFIDLFGAEDTEYTRAVTRKAFTAAVARVYRPGCKFDYVPVLVGEQGIGKSTVLAKMGGPWFSDSVTTLTGKEALESIQGSWIIELGELAGLRRAEVDAVKHFVSKKEDRFRVAYGKRVEHFPRRCVFFGTTNEEDFLRDVTGNRRFWVVNTKGGEPFVDFREYLDADTVSQLWAEAKHRYNEGEPLYLEAERLEAEARKVQDAHLEKDERAGLVEEYLNRLLPDSWPTMDTSERRTWLADSRNAGTVRRRKTCVLEIWSECLEKDPTSITRRDSFEIGRILKTLHGWGAAGAAGRFALYGVQKAFARN